MKNGRWMITGGVALTLSLLAVASATAAHGAGPHAVESAAFCAPDPDPPEYYRFPLVTTKNVPGSARASGVADVTYAATSPFGVSVRPDGSYAYDVHVSVEDLRAPDRGVYTVWVTTSQSDRIRRVGTLGEDGTATPIEGERLTSSTFPAQSRPESEDHKRICAADAPKANSFLMMNFRRPLLVVKLGRNGIVPTPGEASTKEPWNRCRFTIVPSSSEK